MLSDQGICRPADFKNLDSPRSPELKASRPVILLGNEGLRDSPQFPATSKAMFAHEYAEVG